MRKFLSAAVLAAAFGLGPVAWAQDTTAPADTAPAAAETAAPDAATAAAPADDAAAAAATPAPAEEAPAPAEEAKPTLDSGNTAWMLTSMALVLFMTIPGLALFYAGMVRTKNVLSVMMQCFAITSLVTILWAVYAYSLAFTEGTTMNAIIGGTSKFFMKGINVEALSGSIPESVFMCFQMTFAIITPALIVGAFAERMKFSAMLVFMTLWLTVCYAPICHMVWGGGWLGSKGILDFAGGTVVHINAGIAGLVCALVLGKRKGYGETAMKPNNIGYTLVGASMLWVGWFGFNAGSELAADGVAGTAMMATQIATAAAALGWMFAEWIVSGKPTILGIASGAVAGLVAITPASGTAGPMGAIAIGLAAGVICFLAATKLKNALGYDDSLDAFGVHCIGGIVGALLTGVFAAPSLGGFGTVGTEGHNSFGAQFTVQVIGVLTTLVWTGVGSFILLMITKVVCGGLRVSEEAEAEGLDVSLHGEQGYHL
ncbi:ammonium transporter [Solimonas marina]|uniref:Ammonium transporter n=1 Tax=Solimonas marina TaxID=2714601 RepID=A0A969W8N9_9GAMM|nr:ammonium transporter [Solimonas marina]